MRVRSGTPPRHIRTPSFIQDKIGGVEVILGSFKNPETLAYGESGLPEQPLYRVTFNQADVWSSYDGPPKDKVCVDIYEHWLEPAWDAPHE